MRFHFALMSPLEPTQERKGEKMERKGKAKSVSMLYLFRDVPTISSTGRVSVVSLRNFPAVCELV